jgi:hypothetical protein
MAVRGRGIGEPRAFYSAPTRRPLDSVDTTARRAYIGPAIREHYFALQTNDPFPRAAAAAHRFALHRIASHRAALIRKHDRSEYDRLTGNTNTAAEPQHLCVEGEIA